MNAGKVAAQGAVLRSMFRYDYMATPHTAALAQQLQEGMHFIQSPVVFRTNQAAAAQF